MKTFTLNKGIMNRFRVEFDNEKDARRFWIVMKVDGIVFGNEIGFETAHKRDNFIAEVKKIFK